MRLDEFRQHVLTLLTVDLRFLVVADAILLPRYFENPTEQHICRVILEHYREYKATPKRVAILSRAQNYLKLSKSKDVTFAELTNYVNDMMDLQEEVAAQAQYLADEVVKFCREQAVKEATIKNVDDIQKRDYSQLVSRMEKALATGMELQGRGLFLFEDAHTENIDKDPRSPLATGFKFIDGPTKGGLSRREMGLIVAPPNTGKTTALVNIGRGLTRNRFRVAHVSCEMAEALILNMYRQSYLNKSREQLLSLESDQQRLVGEWLLKQKKILKTDVNIKHFSAHRLSITGLKAHLLMLESMYGFKPDALLLDYLDLLEMPGHIRDEVKQLTWVGEELRALGEEQNIAVWTATQTNRGGSVKTTAKMEDIAGDFLKNATADVVISLNQTEKEQEDDLMRWFYVKNRAGKKHVTFTTTTDFERSRIDAA